MMDAYELKGEVNFFFTWRQQDEKWHFDSLLYFSCYALFYSTTTLKIDTDSYSIWHGGVQVHYLLAIDLLYSRSH